MKKARRLYYCPQCLKRVYRFSDKLWIPSECDKVDRTTRLQLVKKP
jgi:ribosomal protein L37AE/L43A